jgi:hypothetical protein
MKLRIRNRNPIAAIAKKIENAEIPPGRDMLQASPSQRLGLICTNSIFQLRIASGEHTLERGHPEVKMREKSFVGALITGTIVTSISVARNTFRADSGIKVLQVPLHETISNGSPPLNA